MSNPSSARCFDGALFMVQLVLLVPSCGLLGVTIPLDGVKSSATVFTYCSYWIIWPFTSSVVGNIPPVGVISSCFQQLLFVPRSPRDFYTLMPHLLSDHLFGSGGRCSDFQFSQHLIFLFNKSLLSHVRCSSFLPVFLTAEHPSCSHSHNAFSS